MRGLFAVLSLLACCLLVAASGCSSGEDDKVAKKQNNTPAKKTRPKRKKPTPKKQNKKKKNDRVEPKKKPKPLPKKPAVKTEPEIVGEWKVTVDPTRTAWTLPDGKPPTLRFNESPVLHDDMFTELGSPFVTEFSDSFGKHNIRVHDMRDGSKLGEFTAKGMFRYNFSPSTDGRRIVMIQLKPLQGVIHEVETGKVVATFGLRSNDMAVDFLDPDRLLLLENRQETMKIIDAATGEKQKEIELGFKMEGRRRYEISPGGKHVAIVDVSVKDGWRIQFYDLESGAAAGSIFIPLKRFWRGSFGMAFSSDGKEFACLLGDQRVRVLCCDIAAGKIADLIEVPKSDRKGVSNLHDHVRRGYRGKRLQFTPDGKGWLIQGHLYLDRQQRQLSWVVPYSGTSGYTGPYRFVGDDLLVVNADQFQIPEVRKKTFWVFRWPLKPSPETKN